jgi:hypothetical protein
MPLLCDYLTASTVTSHIWRVWVDESATVSTLTFTNSQPAWRAWTAPNTNATMPIDVWPGWVTAVNAWSAAPVYSQVSRIPIYSPPTEAELAAQRQEMEERQREDEARRLAQVAANARAEALLREELDAEQLGMLERSDYFEVVAPKTLRRYRIQRGWGGNVTQLDRQGQPVASLCVHPVITVPYADNMLAQKLWIETSEAEFRRVANITQLAPVGPG